MHQSGQLSRDTWRLQLVPVLKDGCLPLVLKDGCLPLVLEGRKTASGLKPALKQLAVVTG